jgi:uncharacterized protein (DUF433 family)
MSTPADREKMLSEMTRAEKAELLQWIVRDLGDDFPGIESKPDVMGGVPCITRTRIPVWLLEQARRLGTSEADLLRDYPTLTVQDLANAWNFVRSHRAEINAQIEANEPTPEQNSESFLRVARSLNLDGPTNWSARLDD